MNTNKYTSFFFFFSFHFLLPLLSNVKKPGLIIMPYRLALMRHSTRFSIQKSDQVYWLINYTLWWLKQIPFKTLLILTHYQRFSQPPWLERASKLQRGPIWIQVCTIWVVCQGERWTTRLRIDEWNCVLWKGSNKSGAVKSLDIKIKLWFA